MRLIGDVKSIGSSIMIQADNLLEALEDGQYMVEFQKYRKSRSLDQNAYFWKLVTEISKKENGDLRDVETLYSHLLMMAGAKYEVLYMREDALESLRSNKIVKHCKVIKREVINNQAMVTVYLFYGSSTFDTKEMSDLIDVTLKYAAEVGVENVDSYWKGVLDV